MYTLILRFFFLDVFFLSTCFFTTEKDAMRVLLLRSLWSSEIYMIETIAILLIVLWALGLVSSYTLGGFVHALLVLAIILILLRIVQGRRIE
jgi:hypothetical protein